MNGVNRSYNEEVMTKILRAAQLKTHTRPVQGVMRPVHPLDDQFTLSNCQFTPICDPFTPYATRMTARCSLNKWEQGPAAFYFLQPTFTPLKEPPFFSKPAPPFLGLGFELLAAGQLVSPRSARFDRIEAPEPLHLAYFRFYHDFLFLSLCFFVLC